MERTNFSLAVDVYASEGILTHFHKVPQLHHRGQPSEAPERKWLYSFEVPTDGLSFERICGGCCRFARLQELAKESWPGLQPKTSCSFGGAQAE